MPSEVKVPWSRPIADPAATRVPSRIVVPQPTDTVDWLYEFSWPGLINVANVNSPRIRAYYDRDLTEIAWNLENLGTFVTVTISRNGATVYTRTLSSASAQESIIGGPISITAGQVVGIRVTAIGDGTSFNLWFGIR